MELHITSAINLYLPLEIHVDIQTFMSLFLFE